MSSVTIDPNLCALAAIAVLVSYIYLRKPSPTPPGPPGLPLIGNILDFPKKESWKVYLQWGQQYSEFLKPSELMVNAHWLSRQRYPQYESSWNAILHPELGQGDQRLAR